MTIRFACACGQKLLAQEAHIGERVKCGACGKTNVVPSATGAEAAASPRSKFPWALVAVVAVLLLLLGGGIGGYFVWRSWKANEESETDLAYIPADANTFLSLRVADAWDKPAGKEFQQQLQKDHPDYLRQFEQNTALRPDQIERFTLVWPTQDNELSYGVILTLKPYDKERVLKAICPNGKDARHLGKTYRVDGNKNAVYAASARVIVVGRERGVQRCLESAGKPRTEGPLKEGLDLLGDGQYQIVGATGPSLPQTGVQGLPDLGMQGGTLTGKIDAGLDLEARLRFSDEKKAKAAQTQLVLAKIVLGLRLASEVSPVLQQMKMRTEGSTLILTSTLDQKQTAKLLEYAAQELGGQSGIPDLPR